MCNSVLRIHGWFLSFYGQFASKDLVVLVYPGEFNFGFSFSCIFRDRKKPASSLQAIGKYLLFYFSYTGVTGEN